jgi:O-antigen/teichoic acid export membrane protein
MTSLESQSQPDPEHKTVRGIFWSYLSFIGGKGMTLVTTIILARLLLPEQFGLMGYCLIVIQYLDIINAAGMESALIARRDHIEEAANAAFIVNTILGILTFGTSWLISPSVALFFHEEQLITLLRVLALTLPISSLGMVPNALLQRDLRFRTKLIPDIFRNIIKGGASIILALSGFGVWSLVLGQIIGVVTGVIIVWWVTGWKPTWNFHPGVNRAIMLYGINILILDFAGVFSNNIDYLFVGRILGTTALGYYSMAFRIPELIIVSLNNVVGIVSFPALAKTQSDYQGMRAFYFSYIRFLSIIVFPIGVGLSLTTPFFIPLFFSSKWEPAIIPTALISIAMAIMAIGYVPGVLYKAINRPEILNYLALVKVPIMVAILFFATRWGINGVATSQIFIGIILVTLDTIIANIMMKYQLIDLIKAIIPGSFATIIMGGVLILINKLFELEGLVGMILMVFFGFITYATTIFLTNRETVKEGLAILKSAFFAKAHPSNIEVTVHD